ncbi:MAG TPA: hypothetical protein VLH09_14375 [Bryobacteraceae bacterium]|nr:hypothetical protein [Bryobacteraceae bacterium]
MTPTALLGLVLATIAKHQVETARTLAQLIVLECWATQAFAGQTYGPALPKGKKACDTLAMRITAMAISQAEAWQEGVRDETIADNTYAAARRAAAVEAAFA